MKEEDIKAWQEIIDSIAAGDISALQRFIDNVSKQYEVTSAEDLPNVLAFVLNDLNYPEDFLDRLTHLNAYSEIVAPGGEQSYSFTTMMLALANAETIKLIRNESSELVDNFFSEYNPTVKLSEFSKQFARFLDRFESQQGVIKQEFNTATNTLIDLLDNFEEHNKKANLDINDSKLCKYISSHFKSFQQVIFQDIHNKISAEAKAPSLEANKPRQEVQARLSQKNLAALRLKKETAEKRVNRVKKALDQITNDEFDKSHEGQALDEAHTLYVHALGTANRVLDGNDEMHYKIKSVDYLQTTAQDYENKAASSTLANKLIAKLEEKLEKLENKSKNYDEKIDKLNIESDKLRGESVQSIARNGRVPSRIRDNLKKISNERSNIEQKKYNTDGKIDALNLLIKDLKKKQLSAKDMKSAVSDWKNTDVGKKVKTHRHSQFEFFNRLRKTSTEKLTRRVEKEIDKAAKKEERRNSPSPKN